MGKGKRDQKSKKQKGKNKSRLSAKTADKLKLYQLSVQCPEAEIELYDRLFREHRGRKALSLREDFCGTALLATEWVKSNKKRTAVGVDLHAPTLEWARTHVLPQANEEQRSRLQLVEGNVLDSAADKVDLTCALNFSYFIFKQRQDVIRYFRAAHAGLNDEGIFLCELFGGSEAVMPMKERRKLKGFTYEWEQADFNPITREIMCHINFRFKDGSKMKHAFTYDWRLWTIPEIRECLLEAGFSKVLCYWDPVDDDEGYRLTEEEENQEGWLVYLVALK